MSHLRQKTNARSPKRWKRSQAEVRFGVRAEFMSRTIIFWLTCVCLLSSGNALFAQKLVNLYVTVQNERAQLIKGMKAENFRVFEDNKPKEIKLFRSESEPASVAII